MIVGYTTALQLRWETWHESIQTRMASFISLCIARLEAEDNPPDSVIVGLGGVIADGQDAGLYFSVFLFDADVFFDGHMKFSQLVWTADLDYQARVLAERYRAEVASQTNQLTKLLS